MSYVLSLDEIRWKHAEQKLKSLTVEQKQVLWQRMKDDKPPCLALLGDDWNPDDFSFAFDFTMMRVIEGL